MKKEIREAAGLRLNKDCNSMSWEKLSERLDGEDYVLDYTKDASEAEAVLDVRRRRYQVAGTIGVTSRKSVLCIIHSFRLAKCVFRQTKKGYEVKHP